MSQAQGQRRSQRALTAAVLVVLALLGSASPALAHAALLQTEPGNGTTTPTAPGQVVLRFDEQVGVALGSVRVLAPDGARIDRGVVHQSRDGSSVVVPLRGGLPRGTYSVLWRVVSADSHPVAGTSSFSVGAPGATAPLASSTGQGRAARDLLAAARLATFAGLVLLVGGGVFLLGLWPAGLARRRGRAVLTFGWASSLLGALGALVLQGPYAAGLGVGHALDHRLLDDVLHTRYGVAAVLRIAVLLLAGALGAAVLRRPVRRAVRGGAAATGAVLLVAVSLAGHPATGGLRWVAVPADSVHLAAVSTWLGGLVVLALVLLPHARKAGSSELAAVLPRWSTVATWSVVGLVATGLFASWREVRELGALTGTTYGRLLLLKTGLVALMLLLGAAGRSWVRRHHTLPVVHASTGTVELERSAPTPAEVEQLRRSVVYETGLGLLVLAVTAVLVQTAPARSSYAPMFHAAKQVTPTLLVTVDVEPARVGVDQLHVYYTGIGGTIGGQALDVPEVSARFSRAGDTVPVPVPRKGRGHYEQLQVPLPSAGRWRLELTTRTSDLDTTTTTFTLPVR